MNPTSNDPMNPTNVTAVPPMGTGDATVPSMTPPVAPVVGTTMPDPMMPMAPTPMGSAPVMPEPVATMTPDPMATTPMVPPVAPELGMMAPEAGDAPATMTTPPTPGTVNQNG